MKILKNILADDCIIPIQTKDWISNSGVCNPSIVKYDGKYYMSVRSCSYTYVVLRNTITYSSNVMFFPAFDMPVCSHSSKEFLLSFSNINDISFVNEVLKCDISYDRLYSGYEDLRLYMMDDKLMVSCTFPTASNVGIYICEFDGNDFVKKSEQYNHLSCEKNWMPIERSNGTEFIYMLNPLTKLSIDKNTYPLQSFVNVPATYNFDIKGSSQVIEYGDYNLGLVHSSRWCGGDFRYFHKFILFDKDCNNIIRESEEFSFLNAPIEFTCGMTIMADKILIPFSTMDSSIYFAVCPYDVFGMFEQPEKETDLLAYYIDEAYRLVDDLNPGGAMSYFTLAAKTHQDLGMAVNLYYEALSIVKDLDIRQGDNTYVAQLMMEDRIIDQIRYLKKEIKNK